MYLLCKQFNLPRKVIVILTNSGLKFNSCVVISIYVNRKHFEKKINNKNTTIERFCKKKQCNVKGNKINNEVLKVNTDIIYKS